VLGNQPGNRCRNNHAHRTPSHHKPLQNAAFRFWRNIERQPIRAGIIKSHAQLQQESQPNVQPVVCSRVDIGYHQQAGKLHQQADENIRFAVPQAEQVDAVAQNAKKNLDNERNQGNGGKNAHICHIQPVIQHIKGVKRGKIAKNCPLGKIQQGEHCKTHRFALNVHSCS